VVSARKIILKLRIMNCEDIWGIKAFLKLKDVSISLQWSAKWRKKLGHSIGKGNFQVLDYPASIRKYPNVYSCTVNPVCLSKNSTPVGWFLFPRMDSKTDAYFYDSYFYISRHLITWLPLALLQSSKTSWEEAGNHLPFTYGKWYITSAAIWYWTQSSLLSPYFRGYMQDYWPPLWSSGQSSWLLTQRSRVLLPALPHFLRSSGSGTGSTQPLWG
jgi:hypothetical protein